MPMSTDPVGSTDYSGVTLDPAGDLNDVAFAVAVYQLESLDTQLGSEVASLKILGELKKAYRERIEKLQADVSNADGDTVILDPDDARKCDYSWSTEDQSVTETAEQGKGTYYVDLGTEVAEGDMYVKGDDGHYYVPAGNAEEAAREKARDFPDGELKVQVKKSDVEAEITRLQGRLDDLNGDGELTLLDINRLLSRRNQALQLTSNIINTTHQSAMGIIANIK